MKIALFQGLALCHYEMILYVFEYCKVRKYDVTIYCHNNEESRLYHQTLKCMYNDSLQWKDIKTFNPLIYNVIVLLSDGDESSLYWDIKTCKKTICIDHYYLIRDKRPFLARINTRYFPTRPNDLYILPVFNGVSLVDKKKNLKSEKIVISTVGASSLVYDPYILTKLFGEKQNELCEFHFILRHFDFFPNIREVYKNYSNVYIHLNPSPNSYFDILKKSNFILCYPVMTDFILEKVSGALFMAFSFCCKLIIPDSWQNVFQFKSAITFGEQYPSSNIKCIDIRDEVVRNLDVVAIERNELLEFRDRILDQIVLHSDV